MNTSRKKARHPVQPLVKDGGGVIRFKENAIVSFLLNRCSELEAADMNLLGRMSFSVEDREQFVQLIGLSLSGFGELPYVSNKTYSAAADQPVMRK